MSFYVLVGALLVLTVMLSYSPEEKTINPAFAINMLLLVVCAMVMLGVFPLISLVFVAGGYIFLLIKPIGNGDSL